METSWQDVRKAYRTDRQGAVAFRLRPMMNKHLSEAIRMSRPDA